MTASALRFPRANERPVCNIVSICVTEEEIMFKRIIFSILLLFPATPIVLAHDTWIEKRHGELVVIYGHGQDHEAYDPANVKESKGFGPKGQAVAVKIVKRKENASLSPQGDPSIVTTLYDGGYRVRTTDGVKKMTKREVKGKFEILEALKIQKHCKAILAPSDSWSKPLGLRFEIVPQKDPFLIKPGDALPIKVALDGKPLEGIVIRSGDGGHSEANSLPRSDKDGMANIIIEKRGFQLINAACKIPLKDDPDADILFLSTSLTFETK